MKRPPGRQSKFTEELADEIVERVSAGEPLAQICRDAHMPCLRAVYDWMDAHPDFAARIARARRSGHDVIAVDALRIADEQPPVTQNGSSDSGFVAWQKNRVWTRLQLLAKWDPKRYGDKLELSGDAENPVAIQRIERVIVKSGQ